MLFFWANLHSCSLKDLLLVVVLLPSSCVFIWECVQNLHPEHGLYVCEFDQDLEEMVSQQFKPQ
jgi:hypothetical protein